MLDLVSNLLVAWSFVAITALLVLYGLLQPWWRSWFGIAMVLVLFALWQIMVRAGATVIWGDDYPGRDWVVLVGRLEATTGLTIAVVGLGRELLRSWRTSGRTESGRRRLDRVPGDS